MMATTAPKLSKPMINQAAQASEAVSGIFCAWCLLEQDPSTKVEIVDSLNGTD